MHKTLVNKPKNFIRAGFSSFPKDPANVSDKIVFLFYTLALIDEKVFKIQLQIT